MGERMFELKGDLALVTGSSRGIGKAIATKLCEAGADIIVHGRSESPKLLETAEELKKNGGKVFVEYADTSDPEQIAQMFQRIKDKHGTLDILVNNAAR